jgi:hypothetical protein
MAQGLKITKLDSPLDGLQRANGRGRGTAEPEYDAPVITNARAASADAVSDAVTSRPAPSPRRSRRRATRAATAPRGETTAAAGAEATGNPVWPPERDFWAPPALDERATLLSTRIPESLSRALELHTRALRDRHGLASQKALPMQEILAAVIWAVGDPEDDASRDRLDAIYRSYRARRMAAAARELRPD